MFLSSLVLALSRPALPAYGIPPAYTTNLTLYHVRGRRILCPRVGRILFYLHSTLPTHAPVRKCLYRSTRRGSAGTRSTWYDMCAHYATPSRKRVSPVNPLFSQARSSHSLFFAVPTLGHC